MDKVRLMCLAKGCLEDEAYGHMFCDKHLPYVPSDLVTPLKGLSANLHEQYRRGPVVYKTKEMHDLARRAFEAVAKAEGWVPTE